MHYAILSKKGKLLISLITIFLACIVYALFLTNTSPKCTDCNLVIISIDTIRPDHMGIYGYSKKTTPNIDKWANSAIVFTRMKTLIPSTFPSFAILMTGKNPLETNIYSNNLLLPLSQVTKNAYYRQNSLPSKSTTLAEILKNEGYATSAFVTNLNLYPDLENIYRGFDEYEIFKDDPFSRTVDKSRYTSFIHRAIPWLEQNKNKKFFLWVHLISPHAPYTPPKDLACNLNPEFCNEIKARSYESIEAEREVNQQCQLDSLDSNRIKFFENLYDAEISYDDKLVGEIVDKIDALKLNKKTVVVLYGDHGEGFDHNFYFNHSAVLYDSLLRIPFIVRYPDSKKTANNNLLDNTMILPSLLKLLNIRNNGVTKNSVLDGNLLNFTTLPNYSFFFNSDLTKYAIQDSTYKYIYSIKDYACLFNNQTDELYDLKNDPAEMHNLILIKPEIAKRLKEALFDKLRPYKLPKPLFTNTKPSKDKEKQEIIDILKEVGY